LQQGNHRFLSFCRSEEGAAAGGGQGLGHRQAGQGFRAGSGLGSLEPLSPQHISQPEIGRLDFRSVRDNDAKEPFGVVPREWYCPNPGSITLDLYLLQCRFSVNRLQMKAELSFPAGVNHHVVLPNRSLLAVGSADIVQTSPDVSENK
jgi:hypothetical protein